MSKDETIDPEISSRFKIQGSKGRQEGNAPPLYRVSHIESGGGEEESKINKWGDIELSYESIIFYDFLSGKGRIKGGYRDSPRRAFTCGR